MKGVGERRAQLRILRSTSTATTRSSSADDAHASARSGSKCVGMQMWPRTACRVSARRAASTCRTHGARLHPARRPSGCRPAKGRTARPTARRRQRRGRDDDSRLQDVKSSRRSTRGAETHPSWHAAQRWRCWRRSRYLGPCVSFRRCGAQGRRTREDNQRGPHLRRPVVSEGPPRCCLATHCAAVDCHGVLQQKRARDEDGSEAEAVERPASQQRALCRARRRDSPSEEEEHAAGTQLELAAEQRPVKGDAAEVLCGVA